MPRAVYDLMELYPQGGGINPRLVRAAAPVGAARLDGEPSRTPVPKERGGGAAR